MILQFNLLMVLRVKAMNSCVQDQGSLRLINKFNFILSGSTINVLEIQLSELVTIGNSKTGAFY